MTTTSHLSGVGVKAAGCLYFAYGSNMNPAQIQARSGYVPKAVAVAALSDHQLAFHGYSKKWDGAQETADRCAGKSVWGIVYELPFGATERLDAYHDVRLDGAGAYFHYPAEVVAAGGEPLEVVLYKKDQSDDPQEPSREYLDLIIEGALAHGLPADYVEALRGIGSHPARYEVPRRSKLDELFGTGCSDCGDMRKSRGGPGFKPA